MIKRSVAFSIAMLLSIASLPQAAYAQMPKWGMFGNEEEAPPEPPQDLPPLPEGAADQGVVEQPEQQQPPSNLPLNGADYYQQQQRQFPPLPPARPCVMKDVLGIWKLISVYEEPSGPEALNFASNRYQYMLFDNTSIYARYASATVSMPPNMAKEELEKQSQDGLHQYVIGENGLMYFYSQGVAVDTQACFIVANDRGPFVIGEMILMPPKGQIKGRLAKVFIRYNGNPAKYAPGVRHPTNPQ